MSDASLASAGQRRKKPLTYGKPTRNPAFTPQSVGSFFDEADKNSRSTLRRIKLPSSRKPPATTRTPSHHVSGRDEFDVPVSDDDDEDAMPTPRPTVAKRKAVPATLRKNKEDNARVINNVPKELKEESAEEAPIHKRTRTSSPVSPAATMTTDAVKVEIAPGHRTRKVTSPSSRAEAIDQGNARRCRRNASKTGLLRPSPVAGLSAPARLSEMVSSVASTDSGVAILGQDQDIIELDDTLSTPMARTPMRPGALRRTTSTTPKQSQLWSQLLSSDPVEPEAEEIVPRPRRPFLTSSAPRTGTIPPQTPASNVDHGTKPRHTRLLDRLKQPTQGEGGLGDDEGEQLSSDEDLVDTVSQPTSGPRIVVSDNTARESQLCQSESQASVSQNVSASKTTYARTRSYLEEDTLEANLMLSLPSTSTIRPTAAERRSNVHPLANGRLSKQFDMDEESDDEPNGGIRSIHELRAAGNKKRFMDDNSALFDDIKDHALSSRSRRRSALMELATKLFDKTFLNRFVEHGFDRELTSELKPPYADPISDASFCVVLIQIAEVEAGDQSLAAFFQAGALDIPIRCLNEPKSPSQLAKDRRNNMSKAAQSTFLEFAESIRTSDIWGNIQPEILTTQVLGLKCMETLILRLRRQGNKGGILNRDVVAKLVGLAVPVVEPAMSTEPPAAAPDTIIQRLALSILEFASTSDALSTTWSAELWSQLVTPLPRILQAQDERRSLALKLCINLTNNNVSNCDVCADGETIKTLFDQIARGFDRLHEGADLSEHQHQLDTLILSLGLMINLAEFSEAAREKTTGFQIHGLATLAGILVRGQERVEEAQSEEETQSNVAYGFLAVLLGNLCQNSTARDEVRACLPGKTLQVLVAAIDEFAQYNMKVDSQSFEGQEGHEVWEHFTNRLMAVVARLQEFDD